MVIGMINKEERILEYINWLYSDYNDIGFKSDISKLDEVLGNFQKGRLITIFSRSGVGKSTLALQIALNMMINGNKIFFGSGEMSEKEVFSKMASSYCLIKYKDIIERNLDLEEKEKIKDFANEIINKDFYVSNKTNLREVVNEIKSYKKKFGLDVLFIDYVNKYVGGIEGNTLSEKIGVVTSVLKELALREDICVVLLAQANRLVDRNVSNSICEKISEADIQDSARIEQDSDQLIGLYRNKKLDNKMYRDEFRKSGKLNLNSKNSEVNPNCINAVILKNRHGEKGTKALAWSGEYSRIEDIHF
ncbi:hypothetical protein CP523_12545 [Clostridium septicum]|uniref:SF4 helicase domain-containing protein n=2 Tax=Clostridium septicum TaxID=1504 RepID=A0A9N7JNI1_CLOSE|nr:hypothetical protein CP523_12545 [Clostridium septicum]QAS60587.1 AAA family ATPase [Clostridium septicum]